MCKRRYLNMNEVFGYLNIQKKITQQQECLNLKRFNRTHAHTSVNELINHTAKHAWHFQFMPHLLLFLKGRELFNNPSVSQAANRLSTINGKAARSQTNLGTDERFRFIRLQRYTSSHLGALSTLLEIFKMHSSWCEEVSENIQSTHSTKRSA